MEEATARVGCKRCRFSSAGCDRCRDKLAPAASTAASAGKVSVGSASSSRAIGDGVKAVSGGGDSFLSASNLDTTELPDGSIEVTLANGETITVPVGYFGYDSGQLFISEKYLPFELAHAASTPQHVGDGLYSKGGMDGSEVLAPTAGPSTYTEPSTYTVYHPTILTQLTAAGAIALAGVAAWYVLTKIGDAPEFEYPIYTTSFEENDTGTVFTAVAKDLDSPDLVYSLRTDTETYDNEHFEIDPDTGALTFITPPNFEAPADGDEGNVYDVKIDATDADGGVGCSCGCAGDFWKREASSSTSLLTQSGACCGLGPSTARGLHPALASLISWVVRPVGAGGLLEAKKGARLLVDPPLAAQVVSRVLCILLDDTTWKRSKGVYHLRTQSHQQQEWQSQIQEKCGSALIKILAPLQSPELP